MKIANPITLLVANVYRLYKSIYSVVEHFLKQQITAWNSKIPRLPYKELHRKSLLASSWTTLLSFIFILACYKAFFTVVYFPRANARLQWDDYGYFCNLLHPTLTSFVLLFDLIKCNKLKLVHKKSLYYFSVSQDVFKASWNVVKNYFFGLCQHLGI